MKTTTLLRSNQGVPNRRLGRLAVLASISVLIVGSAGAPPAVAAFGGANGRLAFTLQAYFAGSEAGIYVGNPDGSGTKKILSEQPNPNSGGIPKWTPDGSMIAFDQWVNGSDNVYVMRPDGTGLRQLTTDGVSRDPTWSPDGTQIAFSRLGAQSQDIWVMNADGSSPADITNSPNSDEYGPDWSPDGTRLVFDSYAHGGPGTSDLWICNADGSDQIDLTPNTDGGDGHWSPDGTMIAFASDRTGITQIYVMNPDGTGVVALTSGPNAHTVPEWSPDGAKIALEDAAPNGTNRLATMNADGSELADIGTISTTDNLLPGWQPLPSSDESATVGDSGIQPPRLHANQGDVVRWDFSGTAEHSISDGAKLGILGSGNEPPGGAYAAQLTSAGTYLVIDFTTLSTETIGVPAYATPPQGPVGTVFTVTVGSAAPLAGLVFDVQINRHDGFGWVAWRTNWLQPSITFDPSKAGTYSFRARLRNLKTGDALNWSPAATCVVTP